MKNYFIIVLFFSMCSINANLLGQTDRIKQPEYYKVSQVRINISNKSDVLELRKRGVLIEGVITDNNYLDTYLDEAQLKILKQSGFPYQIILDDVTKDYLQRNNKSRKEINLANPSNPQGFEFGSLGGFYTFDEVVAQLDTMRLLYPDLISVRDSIGSSIEGRPIWSVKISDNPDVNEDEPEIFYNSLTHAREPGGMMAIMYFMYYLLENYGTDTEVTYLVDNREFYFVPVINPDGYVYNETISPNGGGMWYKNRRDNGDGSFGVSINQNYGYQWGYDDIGSSPVTTAANYRGTGPFSEPETQVIRDYCIEHNFSISINYHTTSGMAYWRIVFPPWGYNLEQTSDSTIYDQLIKIATTLNGYSNGKGNWPSNGDVADYMYGETVEKNRIFGIIPEIGEQNGTNWPDPEQIMINCNENLYPNLVYAWGLGVIDDPPYISQSEVYPSYCEPGQDSIHITAMEVNPDNFSSTVTAYLYNSKDSLIDEHELTKINPSTFYTSELSPQDENFYYFMLKDNGGQLPSNIYYKGNLQFTTAGPVVLDSIQLTKVSLPPRSYKIKPFIRNLSDTATLMNITSELICDDPWIENITIPECDYPIMLPGVTVGAIKLASVQYIDSLFPGYFNFRLKIKYSGWTYWTDSITVIVGLDEESQLAAEYRLEQNYPNPFNPNTKIKYSVPKTSKVQIKVFDLLGNEIEILVNEEKPAGSYELNWNAEQLPSGVYFYQLRAGDYVNTKKMLLLK